MSFVKKVIFGSCHVLLLLKSVDVKELAVCLLSCHYDCLRARAFFFFHLFSSSISNACASEAVKSFSAKCAQTTAAASAAICA